MGPRKIPRFENVFNVMNWKPVLFQIKKKLLIVSHKNKMHFLQHSPRFSSLLRLEKVFANDSLVQRHL